MLEMRPILSALMRNKTGAILIALQIAFTLAVLMNAAFIVSQRVAQITRDSGMDVDNVVTAQSWAVSDDADIKGMVDLDIAALREIPGVIAVTASNQVPLSGGGWGDTVHNVVRGEEGRIDSNAARYMVNEQGLDALGLTLYEGRAFTREDINWREPNSSVPIASVIITLAMAKELFPDLSTYVGQTLYDGLDRPMTVVGVLEQMHGAWVGWDRLDMVMLAPEKPTGSLVRYLVRVEPGTAEAMTKQVETVLTERDRGRVVRRVVPMSEYRDGSYSRDRAMAILMVVVVVMLTLITSLGIVGLASFSVAQRTRQIGTRRAVGARRMHIVRYFLVENWMITTAGVVLGTALGIACNIWLAQAYEIDRLNPLYVPVAILAIWALGLLSVLGPARRAATIQPAIATRTV
ncbi:MAG: FtsX-like permease family protein [Pseudomonadota bacterium]